MVDSLTLNGEAPTVSPPQPPARPGLPAVLHVNEADSRKIPAPGTQRDLEAQTGRSWESLVGEDSNTADRFQTTIWVELRKTHPGLRWEDCADVEIVIDEAPVVADPTPLAASATSPVSAGSGS